MCGYLFVAKLCPVRFQAPPKAARRAAITGVACPPGSPLRLLRRVVALVVFLPFILAVGFVFSSTLKLVAVLALSASVTGLALAQLWLSNTLGSRTARGFLRVSAVAVIAGMVLAAAYELGDAFRKDWLLIPRMASTHGLLNRLGFVLLGLLGWLVELHEC